MPFRKDSATSFSRLVCVGINIRSSEEKSLCSFLAAVDNIWSWIFMPSLVPSSDTGYRAGPRIDRASHCISVALPQFRPFRPGHFPPAREPMVYRIEILRLEHTMVLADRPAFRSPSRPLRLDSNQRRRRLAALVVRARSLLVGRLRLARHSPLGSLVRSSIGIDGARRRQRRRLDTPRPDRKIRLSIVGSRGIRATGAKGLAARSRQSCALSMIRRPDNLRQKAYPNSPIAGWIAG